MPKIAYQTFRFSAGSRAIIAQANRLLADYQARNIIVTLRQLYYRFVALDLFPPDRKYRRVGADKWVRDLDGTNNATPNYKFLGSIINDARLGGLIDWDFLQDRTRNLESLSHWGAPSDIIRSAATSWHRDLWEGQECHVEVFVEKDALLSVIETICNDWDVSFFACRGYTSQSEMWSAGQRIIKQIRDGKKVRIIHLGDHDPSGVDMTRDIEDRLMMFMQHHYIRDYAVAHPEQDGEERTTYMDRLYEEIQPLIGDALQINRIALNMNQIRQYDPPPNPAKLSDSRAGAYIAEHGNESWELDALDPDVLRDLIDDAIREYVDEDLWNQTRDRQEKEREILTATSKNWEKVRKYVEKIA